MDINERTDNQTPAWYWLVCAMALLWNLMGVAAYLMQVGMSAEDLAALKAPERHLYETMPAWATGAFAIAAFGGALGSLALLLRNNLAIPLLIISLAAVLVQMIHAVFMSDAIAVYGHQGMILSLAVVLIALLLVWFARAAKRNGWLH